ncbi:MAG: hypothetical protein ACK4K7_09630 [Allosphingosinicella sp.]|uniref:hypothetical protein n=1 Tax=Allosphingosinicella sp. TaxID=2823234 RepID=UPI00394EDD6C
MLIERTRWVGGMLLGGLMTAWVLQLIDGEEWDGRGVVLALVYGCVFWSMAFFGPVLRAQAWKPSSGLFWNWFVPEGALFASFLFATHRAMTLFGSGEFSLVMLAPLAFAAAIDAAGAHQPVEKAGWQLLRPSISLFAFGLLGGVMLIGGLAALAALVAAGMEEGFDFSGTAVPIAAGVIAFALVMMEAGAILAWQVFAIRLAYGPEGVRYHRLRRVEMFEWDRVERLRRGWLGLYLEVDGGRRIYFSDNLRGFEWFVGELYERGVEVEI